MSGDVQPRKRNKDKIKRKKDDETIQQTTNAFNPQQQQQPQQNPVGGVHSTKMGPNDMHLHVHSETCGTTGGHWCTKLIFFVLMTILAGLIGLILLENRGLADLDTPLSESRYADYLAGWVDEDREQPDDDHEGIIKSLHEAVSGSNENEPFAEEEDDDDDDDDDHDHGDDDDHDEEDEDEDDDHGDDDDDDDDDHGDDEGDDHSEDDQDSAQQNENDDEEDSGSNKSEDDDESAQKDTEEDENLMENSNLTESNEEDQETNENTSTVSEEEDEGEDDEEDQNNNVENSNDDLQSEQNSNDDETEENTQEMNKKNELLSNESNELFDEEEGKDDDDDDDDDDETVTDNDRGEEIHLKKMVKTDDRGDGGGGGIDKEQQESETAESSSQVKNFRGGNQFVGEEEDEDDEEIAEALSKANYMLQHDNVKAALKLFESLLQNYPNSYGARYGKAISLDKLSVSQKSNELLDESIASYQSVLELHQKLSDYNLKQVAEQCINKMRFRGQHLKAVPVHEQLIERFPDVPHFQNQLAVTYMMVNHLAEAKYILHNVLLKWRNDGYAAVHYGFILKNLDHNLEAAVHFLQEGVDSGADGTNDGRFYFNLGDALERLGRHNEAVKVYETGAAKGLFPSAFQRSIYNVERLKSRPFWTVQEMQSSSDYAEYLMIFERNWEQIRDEGQRVLAAAAAAAAEKSQQQQLFLNETENLRDTGVWKQFELFARGRKNVNNCKRTPFTCKLIEMFSAARTCTRGQVKFSVMDPGTHIWPHCGPTNCRLRVHLGLIVPKNTYIRVATETRSWMEGKLLIFDDSFEHEVWHNGTSPRLVLIIDIWHPDLTDNERQILEPI